jgi:anaerobic magnesium-protoporphyrin IX monomethyl ester cyclase
MRVLLIRPSSSQGELTKTSLAQHPINLLYLAAYIRKFGHDVKVIDYEVEDFEIGKIKEYKPDIVGITAMTPTIKKAAKIAREIKRKMKITVLVGGNHVTALPKQTLREFPSFDIGIVGEGEITLKEICENKKLKNILGIVYRKGKKIILNKRRPPIKNLDDLPFPARDLIDMKKYRGASTPGLSREFLNITELYINRGCNWGLCTFCASMLTHRKYRERPIDNVIAEMKECIEKYGINHFTIDDDTLTTSKKRTLDFCSKVRKLNITWDCDSRVTVDKDMLRAMNKSGCKKIAFGVESGSQKVLQMIRKGITVNQIKNAFKWCKEVGIETSAFFMIGSHPDETWEDLEMTKNLIREIKPDFITASIAVPYPGTEIRKQMEERNLIFSNDWSAYALYNTKPPWRTSHFTSQQLLEIQKKMIKDFYMKPDYMLKRLLKIRSFGELKYWIKAFTGVRKTIFKNKKN